MRGRKSLTALLCISLFACTPKAPAPKPFGATPTEQQVEWAQMEYYMFIHFGPNTFTDKEWGHGDEDPKIFNPKHLDARQWAKTAKAAGMKGIIITAKHHDGFCLWPSNYSTHTVRESAWKDGKGDVLRELSDACKAEGLKFGVYLSPWDRNHPDYGTSKYNEVFANTLEEVLTNYGEVFEQWFDGANGEGANGKKQVYDWDLFHKVVYKHQPNAIIFSDLGPGCRWVGNENGFAGTTNWSTLNTTGFGLGADAPATTVLNQGNEDGEHWIPAESDVSIRPGWFYSPSTDAHVKSLQHLLNIYYASVGRNSNLLLNVPVNRDGLIHPNDSIRLMELKETLDKTFKENLATDKKITVSNTRGESKSYGAKQLNDGKFDTYWATDDSVKTAEITLDLEKLTEINRIVLQEYIPLGQRIKSFSVEFWDGKAYQPLDKQTTIGYKRILTFPNIRTTRLKVNILESKASPVLSEIAVYKAPEIISNPKITRNKEGWVEIKSENSNQLITYTTDGTVPTEKSTRFTQPFDLKNGGIVKAKAFLSGTEQSGETITEEFDISSGQWKAVNVQAAKDLSASNAFDANLSTVWSSNPGTQYPHPFSIDLGETLTLQGFTYTPRQDGSSNGIIYRYNFYISTNGKNWQKAISNASFDNIKNNPVKQVVKFDHSYKAKFIRLEAIAPATPGDSTASINEIGLITR
jgi:alpha-L-fucosidase